MDTMASITMSNRGLDVFMQTLKGKIHDHDDISMEAMALIPSSASIKHLLAGDFIGLDVITYW
jgi:hypothetical protein